MARRDPIVIGERGSFYVSGELVNVGGMSFMKNQCYVQYELPVDKQHPYPVVMVHGGGGQGLDFVSTVDGRDGWATDFLRSGYEVYVIDRQGHGRAFYDPDLLGPMGPAFPFEMVQALFAGSSDSAMMPNPFAELHTQWPGSAQADDPALLNFYASQGRMMADAEESQRLMRASAVELLGRIGPAIVITNSAGGAWGWQAADAVPHLVKGIVCIEGAQLWRSPFDPPGDEPRHYAFTAAPMAFSPPIDSLENIKLDMRTPREPGSSPFLLQAEPPRRLSNLEGIPVGYVTGEASFARPMKEGVIANMHQLGLDVDDLALWEHGIHGNGHVPMNELNSAEVAAFMIDWLKRRVESA